MTYLAHEQSGANDSLIWVSHYGGVVAIGQIGGKSIAGISGPWSGKFALTWWDRPPPQRQLQLFDSMDDAKYQVEDWSATQPSGSPDQSRGPRC